MGITIKNNNNNLIDTRVLRYFILGDSISINSSQNTLNSTKVTPETRSYNILG